jgi:hypothetical protein
VATVRECLWGLVEYVKVANESTQKDQIQSNAADSDAAEADTLVCPTGFASKAQKRRKSNGGSGRSCLAAPQHGQRTLWGAVIPVLPKSTGDKFVIEENLVMCTYPGDGLMYPARILGNGPASLAPDVHGCPNAASGTHQGSSSSCGIDNSGDGGSGTAMVCAQTSMVSFLPLEYAAPNQRAACFEVPRTTASLAPIPPSYSKQVRSMLEIERYDTSGDVFGELTKSKAPPVGGGKDWTDGCGDQSPSSDSIDAGIDLSTLHEKYWDQRYRLFSKYDRGILLDSESWFSVGFFCR